MEKEAQGEKRVKRKSKGHSLENYGDRERERESQRRNMDQEYPLALDALG